VAHGNGVPALAALAARSTSVWHGRGVGHRGSRRFSLLGKGSPCRGRPGGEMTGTGVVGCVMPKRRCPWWAWRWSGRREVLAWCLYEVGSWWGPREGGDRLLGVRGGSRSKGRGRGRRTGRASGSPFSPRCQTKKDKEKSFPKRLAIQREIPSRSPSLFLVG
jgi:hypothetical protein